MQRINFFFILLSLISTHSFAFDFQLNKSLYISEKIKIQGMKLKYFWIDDMILEREDGIFINGNDRTIYKNSGVVFSEYDSSVSYDVSKFYKKNRYRLNLALACKPSYNDGVIFFRLDSGSYSDKLIINPSFKLGYAYTFKLNKSTFIGFGISKWFGGEVFERPCLDDYDRAYSCRNLVSWLDKQPLFANLPTSYGLRFSMNF